VPTEPSTSRGDDQWVAQLPATLAACAERWDLVIGERLSGGLVGHVFACTTRTGDAAVLKLNPPSAAEFAGTPEQEAAALRAWAGRGAVELLAFAADLRVLLTRRGHALCPALHWSMPFWAGQPVFGSGRRFARRVGVDVALTFCNA
jgi:hypothetical protein